MNSNRVAAWIILVLVLSLPFTCFRVSADTLDYIPGQVIVRFKDVVSSKQIGAIEDLGGLVIDRVDTSGLVLVRIAENRISAFIDALQQSGLVKYAERNYIDKLSFIPDDPMWIYQWNMPIIQADRAWNLVNGSETILVAVVDSGVDYYHEDLADNYQPGGYDWDGDDGDPYPDGDYSSPSHGTHCAGIVAALLNNSLGVAGLAQVKILAEKIFGTGSFPTGTHWMMNQAFHHATDLGAKIISYSASGTNSSLKYDAVRYAFEHDVLIVAAAGNEGTSDHVWSYPAAYDEVVSVAATDINDEIASYSNWGDWIEISAPGGEAADRIFSTFVDGYGYMHGTSMATPHVSGVAALIWSRYPEYTRDQTRDLLRSSADDLGDPGWDQYYGYGRVNAYRAVNSPPTTPNVTSPDGGEIWSGTQFVTWTASTDPDTDEPPTYQLQYSDDGGGAWNPLADGIPEISYSWDTATSPDSVNCLVRVRAYDGGLYSDWDQSDSVFTVDNNPPTTTIEHTPGSSTVSLSASDTASGVEATYYSIDGPWTEYTGPIQLTDPSHTIECYSVDFAGNIEAPPKSLTVHSLTISVSPSEGGSTNPTPGTYWYDSGALVTVSETPASGYALDHWELDGVNEGIGPAYTVTMDDNHTLTAFFRINNPPTTPNVTSPDGGEIWSGTQFVTWTASTDPDGDPLTYEIQWSDDDGTTWYDSASGISGTSYSWDTATSPDSVNCLVRVRAYDGGLYSDWDQSGVFTVDNTPPSTIHSLEGTIGEGGWWKSSVQVTLSANDDTSGVDHTDYEIDGVVSTYTEAFTISEDGVRMIEYYSVDNAGNTESTQSVEIKIDTAPPEGSITIDDGAEFATSTSVTLSLTYSDVTSGVYQVRYSNDGVWDTEAWESPTATKAWTLTPGDGTKTVYYQVKDDAGWVSSTYSDTIILDTAPPTGSIMINGGESYTTSISVELTLSATDGVTEMCFSNDDVTYTGWEPYNTSRSWTLPAGDGEKTVYAKFKDNAGLISSYSDTIILDTTPPTITDHTPASSDVPVTTTVTVTFSEAMNQASAESAFSIDPPVSGSFGWSDNTMTFTPSSLAYATTYNVTIGTGAEDLAGNNLQSPHSWQFTTSAATITITKLRTNRGIYRAGQSILINAWIEEDGSSLTEGTVTARVYAKVSGSLLLDVLAMDLVDPTQGKWSATYHIPTDGYQGTYVIKVTAEHPPAAKANKIVRRFVTYRLRNGVEARFTSARSPSAVPTNQSFKVKVRIKNPSAEAQTLTVKLILPSGVNLIAGQSQQDIALGAGEKTTLEWTLESTTPTDKLIKVNVLKPGSVVAKLHWLIKPEPTSATTSLASPIINLATAAIMHEHQEDCERIIQQRRT